MRHLIFRLHDEGLFRNGRPQARKRDRPERPGGSAALGVFEACFRNDGHTTENISCNIMLQLIFCSVLNGRGQGKTRSHFRRGFLFCSSSGTWMSGDGDSTAGRRGKLTTGNISWGKMPQPDISASVPGNGASLIRSGNRSRSSAGTHRPMMFAPLRRSFPSRHR